MKQVASQSLVQTGESPSPLLPIRFSSDGRSLAGLVDTDEQAGCAVKVNKGVRNLFYVILPEKPITCDLIAQ